MIAAVAEEYGPPEVVKLRDLPLPRISPTAVLVRVDAAAVTSGDARIRGANFPDGFGRVSRLVFGLRRPRRPVLGGVFSGVVEAVGAKVDAFAVGDEVCGMTGVAMGTHAQYVAAPAKKLARKPASVTHEQAAGLLFGGAAALQFLRVAQTGPGKTVLVNGASGAIGTNAVQLAKQLGAHVTAVTSGRNAALVTDLGADEVIDYTVTPLPRVDRRFDVVLDTVGVLDRHSAPRLLTDDGTAILAAASLSDNIFARGKVKAGVAPERSEDFAHLLGLVADGTLRVVLDEVLDLQDIADAHRRVDSGRKVGNVVVRC
ncbi:putative oxidoreductase [Gordonia araii NBRC 100433]|uniref:Putative oxidoreductase n=1 Tax=Gordonia araii NBRC 100433 TaxID=1073574 RepID=G7GXX4_9ACTN|nr:NAD(P)-dependent alcohol dehydrogenase [Gordonia araii]NNG98355.1 NAD(P)-dependent alcohol dehydrogenase [Gordonia araii NBRC 100433]GAB08449.1 putative oxidoreductase [Gordonia araii NBRC 100433]